MPFAKPQVTCNASVPTGPCATITILPVVPELQSVAVEVLPNIATALILPTLKLQRLRTATLALLRTTAGRPMVRFLPENESTLCNINLGIRPGPEFVSAPRITDTLGAKVETVETRPAFEIRPTLVVATRPMVFAKSPPLPAKKLPIIILLTPRALLLNPTATFFPKLEGLKIKAPHFTDESSTLKLFAGKDKSKPLLKLAAVLSLFWLPRYTIIVILGTALLAPELIIMFPYLWEVSIARFTALGKAVVLRGRTFYKTGAIR